MIGIHLFCYGLKRGEVFVYINYILDVKLQGLTKISKTSLIVIYKNFNMVVELISLNFSHGD